MTLTMSRTGARANGPHRVTAAASGRVVSVRAWVLEAERPKRVLVKPHTSCVTLGK